MTPQHEPILLDCSSHFSLRSGALPSSRRLPTPRAPRRGAVDGAWWPRTTDLVAEGTETATAQALLSAASQPGNELTTDELVAVGTRQSLDHAQNAAALCRWDSEGGHSAPMDPEDRRSSFAGSPSPAGGLI
jgi:hypothetical protein